MLISFYATPRLTPSFWPVVMRNLLVWKKLAGPSILGNIAEPLITLVAFGYGVGSLIGQIDGMPYIEYLASGSVAASAALAATFEALYSAYSRMAVQKTWDSILNAPIALDDIVFAEMLWAAIKALFSCTAILVVIFLLGISRAPTMLLALAAGRGPGAAAEGGGRPGSSTRSRNLAGRSPPAAPHPHGLRGLRLLSG